MHRKKKSKKLPLLLISALLVVLLATGAFYVYRELRPVTATNEATELVEIPKGATRKDIAHILKKKKLIRSTTLFNYYTRFAVDASKFAAGYYELSPAMSTPTIAKHLEQDGGVVEASQVVVREGVNIETIAEEVDKHTEFTKDDFLKAVTNKEFLADLKAKYPKLLAEASDQEEVRYVLEGYLFPKTYPVTHGMELTDLIAQMVEQSQLLYEKYQKDFAKQNLSVHEIFTLASFIENEGKTEKDRALISGVFHNRLDAEMPLQTDVSVAYALGSHREYVTLKDIEVDSPYNTYLYPGLTPGPVNSPSESAILAALHPEKTDYMYFLADIKTGKVYYSKTYEEHLKLQEKYVPAEAPKTAADTEA